MSPIKMSKVESSLRLVLAFYQTINHRDLNSILEFLSEDCRIEHSSPAPAGKISIGKAAATTYWQNFLENYSDGEIEMEEIFGSGERCVARWGLSWTGLTGKREQIRGVDIYRVRNGRIHEILSYVKS